MVEREIQCSETEIEEERRVLNLLVILPFVCVGVAGLQRVPAEEVPALHHRHRPGPGGRDGGDDLQNIQTKGLVMGSENKFLRTLDGGLEIIFEKKSVISLLGSNSID